MVLPFPLGGYRVHIAYDELRLAVEGTPQERALIGKVADLPKPWLPTTCTDSELRRQVWEWLDEVVAWLNHEHTWDPSTTVPACWPRHPHLAHELPVLADRRRRAGLAPTSDLLEEWHRDTLPTFFHRLHDRLHDLCDDGHQPWPGQSRQNRYTSDENVSKRRDAITGDVGAEPNIASPRPIACFRDRPHLVLLNTRTGEVEPYLS